MINWKVPSKGEGAVSKLSGASFVGLVELQSEISESRRSVLLAENDQSVLCLQVFLWCSVIKGVIFPLKTKQNNGSFRSQQLYKSQWPSTPPINFVFLIWCSHPSNTQSKLSLTMIQVNFLSQSEATLLNTKPRLIFFLVFTCKFYSQSEAMLLNTKPWLIFYLVFTCKIYSQKEATLLNMKPQLSICYSYVLPRFKHAIQHKFYSQSEATILNTKLRLFIWFTYSLANSSFEIGAK